MSSLLNTLAAGGIAQQRHIQELARIKHNADMVSLENDLIEVNETIDEQLQEMQQAAGDIASQGEGITQNLTVSSALGDLVDDTLAAYGKDGITEQGAELMRISVESVLIASGIDMPSNVLVPSFESGMSRMDYSTEAEEKKQGLMKRMFQWLIQAFKAMWNAVKGFFGKMKGNVENVEKYIGSVKAKIAKMDASAVGKEWKPGAAGMYLANTEGQIQAPSVAVKSIMSDYQTFASLWANAFGGLKKLDLATALKPETFNTFNEQLTAAIGHFMNNQGVSELVDKQFLPSHTLSVIPGSDKANATIGSKVEVKMVSKYKDGEAAPGLSKSDMSAGLDSAEAAMGVVKKLQTTVDQWLAYAAKIDSFGGGALNGLDNDIIRKSFAKAEHANDVKVFKVLVAANAACVSGWTQTVPLLLAAVRANIKYVEQSAGSATVHKDGEFMPGEKPAATKPDEKKERQGETIDA